MRSSLFWDVTQCRLIVRYRGLGSNVSVPSSRVKQHCFTLEDMRCITTQKSEDLIYTVAKTCNLVSVCDLRFPVCSYETSNKNNRDTASIPKQTSTLIHSSVQEGWLFSPSLSGFGGLVVSVLASGTQNRGFKPCRSRRIFRAKKIGGEVKASVPCRRFAAC